MSQPTAAPAEMIPQLEAARRLVLGDAHFYPQIVPGILPIIGPAAPLEVRRWGADFLAETFSSPALGNARKDELSSVVLPNLRGLLEIPGEDAAVVKSVVQTVSSIYSLVFRKWYVTQVNANLRRPQDPAPSTLAVLLCHNITLNSSDILLSSISRHEEAATWQNMVAIKSNILKRMDTAPIGVRVCCIKLLQRIVQVQTPGVISDPRVS
jgi:symplekin